MKNLLQKSFFFSAIKINYLKKFYRRILFVMFNRSVSVVIPIDQAVIHRQLFTEAWHISVGLPLLFSKSDRNRQCFIREITTITKKQL